MINIIQPSNKSRDLLSSVQDLHLSTGFIASCPSSYVYFYTHSIRNIFSTEFGGFNAHLAYQQSINRRQLRLPDGKASQELHLPIPRHINHPYFPFNAQHAPSYTKNPHKPAIQHGTFCKPIQRIPISHVHSHRSLLEPTVHQTLGVQSIGAAAKQVHRHVKMGL